MKHGCEAQIPSQVFIGRFISSSDGAKKNNTVVRWLHLHFIDLQRPTWRSSSADVCSRWTAATGTRAALLSFWLLTAFNLISPARFVLQSLRLCPRKRFRDSSGSVHPECRVGDVSKTERGATSGRAEPARTHQPRRGAVPKKTKKKTNPNRPSARLIFLPSRHG